MDDSSTDKGSVLYVLSVDQQTSNTNTLAAAQKRALELKLPLAVVFCFYSSEGHPTKEESEWIVDALRDTEQTLNELSIPLIVLIGDPKQRLEGCIKHLKPTDIYFDQSSLDGPKELHRYVAGIRTCKVHVVSPNLKSQKKLKKHPHRWIGPIMPIKQLERRITQEL